MPKTDYFRSDVARGGNLRVDRKSGIISGFAVVTKGVTKDERGEFDDTALDRVVELGNASKIGIKSRFGHPNMSSTALGTFLGRVRDFRRDGDIVRADLHIDKTAHNTPDGDLAKYVMALAESDPEAFGSSMVIYWEEEAREPESEGGKTLAPLIRVEKLSSVDIVDDPAANDGLFGMPFFSASVKPSFEMSLFLDKFLQQEDAVNKVISFLQRYQSNIHNPKEKEEKRMAEQLTVDQLKREHPDVFDNAYASGVEEGKRGGIEEGQRLERERTVSILKKAKTFKDMHDLALDAVEDGLSLEQAVINFQQKQLDGIKNASPGGVGPDAESPQDVENMSHLDRAKQYQREHNCAITDALKATADKRS